MKLYRATLEKPIVFPDSIIITADNFDSIDFDKVLYCEVSPPGAMGNEGGILIYVLGDKNNLITYETNLALNKELFDAALWSIKRNAYLIVNYDGSMGNYVYIRKGAQFEIDEKNQCFWYHSQNTKLKIESSVKGVFLHVVSEMTGETN